ncbi:MAG: flavodoxin [Methylococcales bacterium]|nr:flavodoxin [Methylococcales bacterium]
MKIGLFYSSDTGNTESVAEMIQEEIGQDNLDIHEVFTIDLPETIAQYEFIILGVPTWYDGEVQNEWADKLDELEKVNLTGCKVAVYGLGDQEDWGEFFCDAIAVLAAKAQGSGATIIGHWSSDGYEFTESKALIDEKTFIGLTLDEDRQSELTESRIKTWLEQLKVELGVDNWQAELS